MIEYENLKNFNSPFVIEYRKVFNEFLENGWYILGKNVEAFENEFATFLNTNYVIGVANGLDALTLSLKAFDLEAGSEVIVPSNTYIATILAIINAGLKPVLVEPDIKTYNIDTSRIEIAITSKTKAILVVHLYGKACDMDHISNLCDKYGLKLIEDCAQSHGAMYKNKKTGTFGDAGCFSFYPTKNLGALGDAGAVACDSHEIADKIKTLRNYGSKVKYQNDIVGYNSRMDELQASFLRIKLKKLDDIIHHKRKLAFLYLDNLSDKFIKPVINDRFFDVFHIFNIRHPKRDELKEYLLKNGVKTEIHYPIPPHKQKCMKGILSGEYPISEEIHDTTISLPISYFHSADDIMMVCDILNKFD